MSKRILMVYGHPLRDSFNTALGTAYVEGARAGGAEIRELFVHDLVFDHVLHYGYRMTQALEPDLLNAQADFVWAEHLVFAFPIWWGMPPAKVKALIDRAFHPTWAFKFHGTDAFPERLLTGRSARLIVTMDTPPWYFQLFIGNPGIRMMKHSVLKFCGISPVRASQIGSVRFSTMEKRKKWLQQIRQLGAKHG
jgi:NAD(P)H dehydrogenase (quinone)